MNKTKTKIALIGGDMRGISAARSLEENGYEVAACGFDTYSGLSSLPLEQVLSDAQALLLPVPTLRSEYINAPFSSEKISTERIINSGSAPRLVFGGMIPDEISDAFRSAGSSVHDLCKDERFNIMNAVPTSEGALAIAMSNTERTIDGSTVFVLGYGRIGKVLCRLCNAMGAKVFAISRSKRDLAESAVCQCTSGDYRFFKEKAGLADIIFNTVPAAVIDHEILSLLKDEAIVIDLASKPGGVDLLSASKQGKRVISALSLPGKVAPITAGKIIADCVISELREAGL